ncbi:MAG: DUF3048 domain-containing protein [Oscillospiraceae bacterium]|nr:DUF3048 domain-containing protein [Oscillospiraceae bacterium]
MNKFLSFFIILISFAALFCSCDNTPPSSTDSPNTTSVKTYITYDSSDLIPVTRDIPNFTFGFSTDGNMLSGSAQPDAIILSDFRSGLTGLPISEKCLSQRPIAVMINNERRGLPQSGISLASVIYECNIEGGVNRLIAIFEDYAALPYIGTVRSSRPYFIDIAQMHDAIYVHCGGSPGAYESLKERNIDNIDGVNGGYYESQLFYYDQDRLKNKGLEHCRYISGAKIVEGIKKAGFRTAHKEDNYKTTYNFIDSYTPFDTNYSPQPASYIYLPHHSTSITEFSYNSETKKYYRSQYGAPTIDALNGKQVCFENVIVIFTLRHEIDDYGRLFVELTGTGEGYYACEGKYIPIKWKRDSIDGKMDYLNADGTPLYLNPGKTFVSVASTGIKKNVVIK